MRFCRPILSLKKVILACILQGIVAEVICCTVLFFFKGIGGFNAKEKNPAQHLYFQIPQLHRMSGW